MTGMASVAGAGHDCSANRSDDLRLGRDEEGGSQAGLQRVDDSAVLGDSAGHDIRAARPKPGDHAVYPLCYRIVQPSDYVLSWQPPCHERDYLGLGEYRARAGDPDLLGRTSRQL